MLADIRGFVAGDKRLFFGKPREAKTAIVSIAPGEIRLAAPIELAGEPREYAIVAYDEFGEDGHFLRSFSLEEGGSVIRAVEFAGHSWGSPRASV